MLVAGVSVKRTVTTIVTVITPIVFFFPWPKKKKKLLLSYLLLSIYIYSLWQTLLLSKAAVYSRGYKLEVVVSSIETMVRVFVFVYITGRRGWETFEWFALKVYACVCKREIWRESRHLIPCGPPALRSVAHTSHSHFPWFIHQHH